MVKHITAPQHLVKFLAHVLNFMYNDIRNYNETLSISNLMEEIYDFIALYLATNRLVAGYPAY